MRSITISCGTGGDSRCWHQADLISGLPMAAAAAAAAAAEAALDVPAAAPRELFASFGGDIGGEIDGVQCLGVVSAVAAGVVCGVEGTFHGLRLDTEGLSDLATAWWM